MVARRLTNCGIGSTDHSSLGTTPLLRWQRDIEHIRQLPPATDFRRLFFHRLDRVVRRDCIFLLLELNERLWAWLEYPIPPADGSSHSNTRFDRAD